MEPMHERTSCATPQRSSGHHIIVATALMLFTVVATAPAGAASFGYSRSTVRAAATLSDIQNDVAESAVVVDAHNFAQSSAGPEGGTLTARAGVSTENASGTLINRRATTSATYSEGWLFDCDACGTAGSVGVAQINVDVQLDGTFTLNSGASLALQYSVTTLTNTYLLSVAMNEDGGMDFVDTQASLYVWEAGSFDPIGALDLSSSVLLSDLGGGIYAMEFAHQFSTLSAAGFTEEITIEANVYGDVPHRFVDFYHSFSTSIVSPDDLHYLSDTGRRISASAPVGPVPLPGTGLMLGLGLAALGVMRRRKPEPAVATPSGE